MSYSIIYRDSSVDYYYETLDHLEDAREVYEKVVEEMKGVESVRMTDQDGETIESHVF